MKDEPFSKEVLECLPPANFRPGPEDIAKREDLRDICVCSIDPPGCEDIDDCGAGPCQNGKCTDVGANSYVCDCDDGWTDMGAAQTATKCRKSTRFNA